MKTPMTHSEYQRLELISDSQSTDSCSTDSCFSRDPSPAAGRNIWQSLLSSISGSAELRVWKAANPAGQLVWKIYDPVTQIRNEFASELDLRIWLEERYYQTPAATMSYMAR